MARRPLQRQALSRLVRLRARRISRRHARPLASARCSLVLAWNSARNKPWSAHAIKIIGLAILFAVPFAIYIASGPGLYPAINPATGGPTGESQLESSLGVVAILLIVPFGVARRKSRPQLASRHFRHRLRCRIRYCVCR